MSEDTKCGGCGEHLLFSARARGNGLCGPCMRASAAPPPPPSGTQPDIVHAQRSGESLCKMELHEGPVPLTIEHAKVTCNGCIVLLAMEKADRPNASFGASITLARSGIASLREAVALVAERCSCTDGSCPFRTAGGMHTNGGCQLAKERLRGHQLNALGKLFAAARALVGDAQPVEPTPADVWRTEAERLRHLLGEMIGAAWNQPQPWPKYHREWLERMESEMEQAP